MRNNNVFLQSLIFVSPFADTFSDHMLMKLSRHVGSKQFQLRAYLNVPYDDYQKFLQAHSDEPQHVSYEILRVSTYVERLLLIYLMDKSKGLIKT